MSRAESSKKLSPKQRLPLLDNRVAVVAAVFVVAFLIRCLYLWQISGAPFWNLRIGDGEAYHQWARRIADGDWLGTGVFYQAPLYPYFLAVIYRLLDDSTATVRTIQALIGAGSCALLADTGMRLFGRTGAIAGLALAIYPSAIFLDGQIEKTALMTFLTTALIWCIVAQRWLATGIILGLLALTRENALILAVPILLWIGRRRAAVIFAAGCALVLLPVGVRNRARGGEFHLTTSQFGPNFYIGNHAGAKGTYEGLVVGHGSVTDEREDATRLSEQTIGRKLTPGEVSSYWAGLSLDYIRSQPFDWLKLMVRKVALTFNAAEVSDTESQDVYAEWSWLLKVPLGFGVLLGAATFAVADWRRLWWLWGIAVAYAVSVAAFYVFARYRFPIVPVLMLLAAGAWRKPARPVLAGSVAALAFAFAHLPLTDSRTARATNYVAIASALSSEDFYRRALEADPHFPAAQFGLGTLLAKQGRTQEAISHYRTALAEWPDYVDARYNLGVALAGVGQSEEAIQQFEHALRVNPDDAETQNALAQTHNDLGAALAGDGRFAEALPHFERALALNPADLNVRRNLEEVRLRSTR